MALGENVGILVRALGELVVNGRLYGMIGGRNLMQARRRTLILGAALAFVAALFVLFQGLVQGATEGMVRSATTLSAGHVNVGGFYKLNITDASPVLLKAGELRKVVEENTPGLERVIDRQRGWSKIVSDTSSQFAGLTGVDPREEQRLLSTLVLAEESAYREGGTAERKGDLGRLGEPGTIVLFASQAKKLSVGVGDDIVVTTQGLRGAANSAQLRVVAVCEDLGLLSSWSTFVAKKTVLDLYQLQADTTGAVMVYLKDIDQAEATMGHLRKMLADKGWQLMDHESQPFFMKFQSVQAEDWTGQKLDLTTWSDEVSFLTKIVGAIGFVGTMLLGILLVIIVVGIINAMWISVRERTPEIGTLRAVGMDRHRVLAMFLAEATLLGLGASAVGIVLGGGVALVVNGLDVRLKEAMRMVLITDTLQFSVTPGALVTAAVLFTLVTALAALWPALRAARMQPVTAIQSVQ
jgi:putative ABC transport system permease protein